MRGWVSPGCPHPLCQEWLEGAELTLSAPQFFGFPFVRSLGAEQKFLNLAKHYWNCLLPAPALLKSKGAWLQQGVWQGPKAPLQGAQLCAGCTVSPQAGEGAGGVPGKVGRAGSTPGHWECPCPSRMSSKLLPNHSGMPLSLQSSLLWNLTWGSLEKRSMSVKIKCGCCGILSLITARVTWREV